jgi:2-polyprenyl-3-methyl-5-hydroxy-6-metoxy-1,4-benzoquinol methylase
MPDSRLAITPAGSDTATPLNLAKRLAAIERFAAPLAGKRVIDCGCGGGEYVRVLAAAGADCVGFEYQGEKLAKAARPGVKLAVADIERLPVGSERFDVALVNEVLEHVPDEDQALREVFRVLRPGGLLLLFSPNRLYPFETHGVFTHDGRRVSHAWPGIPYLPLAVGRHFFRYWARNYWPWQLRRMLAAAGFETVDAAYVWQTFENISGRQPGWMAPLRGVLRGVAGACERTPGLKSFGVSQLLVAQKP